MYVFVCFKIKLSRVYITCTYNVYNIRYIYNIYDGVRVCVCVQLQPSNNEIPGGQCNENRGRKANIEIK